VYVEYGVIQITNNVRTFGEAFARISREPAERNDGEQEQEVVTT